MAQTGPIKGRHEDEEEDLTDLILLVGEDSTLRGWSEYQKALIYLAE